MISKTPSTRLTACVLMLAGGIGCNLFPQASSESDWPKTLDRLVAAYPEDLANKRFQLIADFEDPRHAGIFRREPDRNTDAVVISTARAQHETGVGSLKIFLSSPGQQVVVADSPDAEWALHQDWAPYHLLMLSVFSPREQGGFRFSIRSGTNSPLIYEHPRIFLKEGWNRLRIDLAEVAERVYLGDVRELRFWCDPLDSPIELHLDDLLVADNTRELMAAERKVPGELSVRAQGRRLVVRSEERFELVFSRGRIRQWFDLASDPERMHNLAGSGYLGPTPAVLGNDGLVLIDHAAQWLGLGQIAEAYQGIEETSPLYVVVHGEWRFGLAESPPGPASPYHRWIYHIYRGGEVYVECSGSVPGMNLHAVGIAFGCDGAAGFERTGGTSGESDTARGIPYVLFSQPRHTGSANMLVTPSKPLILEALENPDESRVCAMYRLPVEADQFMFAAQMRVWPSDIDGPAQAGPMAVAYVRALPVELDTGTLVRTDPGDLDRDGYSEARGYYVIQLDGRVAKLRLDGTRHLRFSPAFKLVDVSDRDVWVYADGRQVRDVHRDQNGDLFFEIPGVISHEMLIEITAAPRQQGG